MTFDELTALFTEQPVIALGALAILAALLGWLYERERPQLAGGLRKAGYVGMVGAGMLTVFSLAGKATHSEAVMMLGHKPAVEVRGGETVVEQAPDGHFWVRASVNGIERDFLIDTGATLTGLSRSSANEAGITPDPGRAPITLQTANGTIEATLGTATDFRFGNIRARDLTVAVPRDLDDDTNVVGMNLLSQLASWRVEGDRLILVPKG